MALFGKQKSSFAKASEDKEGKENVKKETTGLPQGKDPFVYKIINKPIVTERAVDFSNRGRYVFKVFPRANKVEIRKAVEKLYGVKVKEVKIINVIGKKRQIGRFKGLKSGFKKAIVSLKEGQKIEITSS